jgi:hypothetical protein
VGLMFGGVGALPGAAIGGVLGGLVGGAIGGGAASGIFDALFPPSYDPAAKQAGNPQRSAPPLVNWPSQVHPDGVYQFSIQWKNKNDPNASYTYTTNTSGAGLASGIAYESAAQSEVWSIEGINISLISPGQQPQEPWIPPSNVPTSPGDSVNPTFLPDLNPLPTGLPMLAPSGVPTASPSTAPTPSNAPGGGEPSGVNRTGRPGSPSPNSDPPRIPGFSPFPSNPPSPAKSSAPSNAPFTGVTRTPAQGGTVQPTPATITPAQGGTVQPTPATITPAQGGEYMRDPVTGKPPPVAPTNSPFQSRAPNPTGMQTPPMLMSNPNPVRTPNTTNQPSTPNPPVGAPQPPPTSIGICRFTPTDLTQVNSKLDTIITRVGEPTLGDASLFQAVRNRTNRIIKSQLISMVLNMLNFVTVLHNAWMLSSNLAATLGELTGMAITSVGRLIGLVGAEEVVDANAILGQSANDFMKGILGEENWNGTKKTLAKWNRIYQTGANLMWTMRSISDSTREIAEWTAENTGKIGNALKKFRVVGENAYKWMPEQVTAQGLVHRRFAKFRDGTESLDDAASSLSSVLGEVVNIQDEVQQIREQHQNFNKAIEDATPKDRPDNKDTKTKADASDTASKSPNVAVADKPKADPPEA